MCGGNERQRLLGISNGKNKPHVDISSHRDAIPILNLAFLSPEELVYLVIPVTISVSHHGRSDLPTWSQLYQDSTRRSCVVGRSISSSGCSLIFLGDQVTAAELLLQLGMSCFCSRRVNPMWSLSSDLTMNCRSMSFFPECR